MLRFVGTILIVGTMALAVYGGAVLLFPSFLPSVISLGAASDVPAAINHQGVVTVNGVRFTGTGLFRFAIVESGSGNNVWTNSADTSPADGEPDAAVSVAVTDGVYTVRLGDTTLANMAAVSSSLFADGNLKLRVWFDDGTRGSQQLSPDHILSSVPYAFRADTVSPGGIGSAQLATGAVGTSQIAGGAVSSDKLASGIAAWSKSGTDATWSGAVQTAGLFGGLGDVVQDSRTMTTYTAFYGGSPGDHPITEFDITLTLPHRSIVMQTFTGSRVRDAAGECYPRLYRSGSGAVNNSFVGSADPGTASLAMHNMAVLNAGQYTFQMGIYQASGWSTSTWRVYGGSHTVIALPIP